MLRLDLVKLRHMIASENIASKLCKWNSILRLRLPWDVHYAYSLYANMLSMWLLILQCLRAPVFASISSVAGWCSIKSTLDNRVEWPAIFAHGSFKWVRYENRGGAGKRGKHRIVSIRLMRSSAAPDAEQRETLLWSPEDTYYASSSFHSILMLVADWSKQLAVPSLSPLRPPPPLISLPISLITDCALTSSYLVIPLLDLWDLPLKKMTKKRGKKLFDICSLSFYAPCYLINKILSDSPLTTVLTLMIFIAFELQLGSPS